MRPQNSLLYIFAYPAYILVCTDFVLWEESKFKTLTFDKHFFFCYPLELRPKKMTFQEKSQW